MNNNGSAYKGNGNSSRRSLSFEFCEPVAANAAIFVALIILDVFNNNKEIIPVHAVGGILITLMTLALCRYGFHWAAWAFAIAPAIFLVVTFLYAASKNTYVIAAQDRVSWAAGKVVDTAKYTTDQSGKIFNKAVSDVNYINESASGTFKGVGDSISNTWNAFFNSAKVQGKSDAAAAVVATAATGGTPPAGTAAGAMAAAAIPTGTTVAIKGEFNYLCGDGSAQSIPKGKWAEDCKKVRDLCSGKSDVNLCRDESISILDTPAVCLGGLPSGGAPPPYDKRDACLACPTDNKTKEQIDKCRCTALGNCPAVTITATVANAAPAGRVSAFTDYMSGSW